MLGQDQRIILHELGNVMLILGILLSFTIIIPVIFGELWATKALAWPALFCLCAGALLAIIFRNSPQPELKHAMILAAICWLIVPIISSIPITLIEGMPLLDSIFEGMAGWTDTGLTMVKRPSELTHTIQFWRSLMQWVGGIGVIVLMVSIITRPGTGLFALYKSEGREERIKPSIASTVRTIWWIFLLFTALAISLLYFIGVPLWEAINHGMTAIATGGFSITDESIATYNSILVEILIMVITIIGAIPFLIHYKILHGNWKAFFRDVQCKALILIAFIGILILALENYAYFGSALASFRYSAFQLVSGLTTTGFQTAPVHNWSPTAMIILAMIMVIGGAAGSTAGGMKLLRAVLSWKGMTLRIRKAITPSGVITCFKLGDERLSDEEANSVLGEATTIGLLWIFFLILGIVVMLHLVPPEFGLEDVIFEVASAQGNVGLSTGITGPELPAAAKIMLIFNMWIGRLEIIPVLLLFRSLIAGFKITSA